MPPTTSTDSSLGRREAALRFLLDRIDYEKIPAVPYRKREFKLERMHELLARLGNPQATLPIVHVAGTKGKGSTAAMLGSVLSSCGYRTGVYTSPHLERIEERLAVDGRPCTSEELIELVDHVVPAVEQMDRLAASRQPPEVGPTYFEITTAMALAHFARLRADAVILEVGLGGRLDSTNVCRPRVSVITSISYDHTRQLGNTLESIAREKAGIVKTGVPVVSGVVDAGPSEVIRRICRDRGCRLVELGKDFDFRYEPPRQLDYVPALGKLDFHYRVPGRDYRYEGICLRLLGKHQASNAAVALATLAELQRDGWEIPEASVRRGLKDVSLPARVDLVCHRPAVVVDAAHNLASVDALVGVLKESFAARRRLLVFATTQEKDIRGMLRRLLENFDEVVFTRYLNNPRAVPPEELETVAQELTGREYRVCANPADAWGNVRRSAHPDDLICVTGSFFIAAEMRHEILVRPLVPPADGCGAVEDSCQTVDP